MTDEEKLKAAQELDAAYARSEVDRRDDDNDKLDAYGHLNWTVGNEDWIACFDARRTADGIEYHVVVDCESGGPGETYRERLVRCNDQHITYFEMCMGWVEGRN